VPPNQRMQLAGARGGERPAAPERRCRRGTIEFVWAGLPPAADARSVRRHPTFTVAAAAGYEQDDASQEQDQRIETSARIK
jgi:hypothetical protein